MEDLSDYQIKTQYDMKEDEKQIQNDKRMNTLFKPILRNKLTQEKNQ